MAAKRPRPDLNLVPSSTLRSAKRQRPEDPSPVRSRNPSHQNTYDYQPVNPDETRLLVLRPGIDSDPLHGELILRQGPQSTYAAISYAWGAPDFNREIHLNGRRLAITHSAASALRRFRDPQKSRALWIDSICIDQHNTSEKNAQVARMGAIYQDAEEVLIWLGDATDGDSMAFWACDRLSKAWKTWSGSSDTGDEHWEGSRKSGFARRALEKEAFENACPCCAVPCEKNTSRKSSLSSSSVSLYQAAQESVRRLFRRPYFDRLWPVQEICMGRQCTLYAGSHTISFPAICHALEMLATLQAQLLPQMRLFQFLTRTSAAISGAGSTVERSADFFELLEATARLTTGDARDRVYALRSLIDPQLAQSLQPDYAIEMRDLWIKSATVCLQTSSSTSLLLPASDKRTMNGPMLLAMASTQRNLRSDATFLHANIHTLSVPAIMEHYRSLRLPSWAADLQGKETLMWKKYQYYATEDKHCSAGSQKPFEAKVAAGKYDQIVVLGKIISQISRLHKTSEHPDCRAVGFLPANDPIDANSKNDQLASVETKKGDPKTPADITTSSGTITGDSQLVRESNLPYLRWFKECHRIFKQKLRGNDQADLTAEATSFLLQGHRNISPDGTSAFELEMADFEATTASRLTSAESRALQNRALDTESNNSARHVASRLNEEVHFKHPRAIFRQAFPTLRKAVQHSCMDVSRVIAELDDGRLAWVPMASCLGDHVCLVQGAPCPFILRAHEDGGYVLLGDAYVHGIMQGEGLGTGEDGVVFEELYIR